MSTSQGFCEYLLDQLSLLSGISLRRMFGGAGIYRDGVMFGLVAEDTFYLKADDRNRSDFQAVGMGPFVYDGQGKQMAMPYFQVPTDILEDRERLASWARTSHEVAASQKKTNAAPKAKAASTAKAAPQAKAASNAKAAPKAKAASNAKAASTAKAAPKAKAASRGRSGRAAV